MLGHVCTCDLYYSFLGSYSCIFTRICIISSVKFNIGRANSKYFHSLSLLQRNVYHPWKYNVFVLFDHNRTLTNFEIQIFSLNCNGCLSQILILQHHFDEVNIKLVKFQRPHDFEPKLNYVKRELSSIEGRIHLLDLHSEEPEIIQGQLDQCIVSEFDFYYINIVLLFIGCISFVITLEHNGLWCMKPLNGSFQKCFFFYLHIYASMKICSHIEINWVKYACIFQCILVYINMYLYKHI